MVTAAPRLQIGELWGGHKARPFCEAEAAINDGHYFLSTRTSLPPASP